MPSKLIDTEFNRRIMERLFKIRIFTVMFFLAVASIAANAKESKKEGDNYHAKQILIVGLHDNVKSNYFYNGMIAEETGMKEKP